MLRIGGVGLDCPGEDASGLEPTVAFWSQALGYVEGSRDERHVFLHHPERRGPWIYVQRVPETAVGKNPVHLDLRTDDLDGDVARLLALGATTVGSHEHDGTRWTVLADPVGRQFCVVAV